MIIRSQDKKCIVNLDNIDCIYYSNKENGIIVFNGEAKSHIGKYSTEEKSIKVLDMIQEEYEKHYYGQGGPMATVDYYVPPFAFIPPKVFQMPSDEEIEV